MGPLQIFPDQTAGILPGIHKHSVLRALAQGLNSQLARAAKQVQYPGAGHIKADDAEQGLFHPVRGGTGEHPPGRFQRDSFGFSCDNAHSLFSQFFPVFRDLYGTLVPVCPYCPDFLF